MLLKFTVTFAPAGTVIVLMLNAMFWATRSMVTADDEVVVVGVEVVGGGVVATVVLGGAVVVVVDGDDEHPHAAIATISNAATEINATDFLGNCLSRFISCLLVLFGSPTKWRRENSLLSCKDAHGNRSHGGRIQWRVVVVDYLD